MDSYYGKTWEFTSGFDSLCFAFFAFMAIVFKSSNVYVLLCYQLCLICPLLLLSTNSNEIRLEAVTIDEAMKLSQRPWNTLSTCFIASCFTLEYMHFTVMCIVKQLSITGIAKEFWINHFYNAKSDCFLEHILGNLKSVVGHRSIWEPGWQGLMVFFSKVVTLRYFLVFSQVYISDTNILKTSFLNPIRQFLKIIQLLHF